MAIENLSLEIFTPTPQLASPRNQANNDTFNLSKKLQINKISVRQNASFHC